MLPQAIRRRTARILLLALLFAQSALAIAACNRADVSAAQAVSANRDVPSCHEAPPKNANLCLADCLSADQSLDTAQVAVPAWGGTFLVEPPAEVLGASATLRRHVLPHAGAPPPRILFQTFLI